MESVKKHLGEPLETVKEKLNNPESRAEMFRKVVTIVFDKGDDVVGRYVDNLIPIFAFTAPIVKLLMGERDSKEVAFMKEQFAKVERRMQNLLDGLKEVDNAVAQALVDTEFFEVEENIIGDFRRYMTMFQDPNPKHQAGNKKDFMKTFEINGKDKSLHVLFDGVMGKRLDNKSILKVTQENLGNSRRHMEDFCTRLKHLFAMGIIALLGYAGLEGCGEEEGYLKEWSKNMETIQEETTKVIEDCIQKFPHQAEIDTTKIVRNIEQFPDQAETDTTKILRNSGDLTNQELAAHLLEKLKEKYDWVCWFVRVYAKPKQSDKPGLLTKKAYDQCQGKSSFEVKVPGTKYNIRVSYSSSPEPLNKKHIQEQIGKLKGVSGDVAEHLHRELLSGYMVHAFEAKDLGYSSSFADPLQYWGKYNKIYIFIHSI